MKKRDIEEWYKSVDFIKKEMQFYSASDFWEKKDIICYYFKNGNSYLRQMYMWYFFSNPNLSDKQKTLYWDIIVGFYSIENEWNNY